MKTIKRWLYISRLFVIYVFAQMHSITLRGIRYQFKLLERNRRTKKIAVALDYMARMVGNRKYTGENPAIQAAYSPMRHSMNVMLILFVVIFILGSLVPIKSAAVSHGTIVVSSYKKTIQHLEGGIIRTLLVADGDVVKQGQSLVELNDVTPKSNRNLARTELYAARVAEARLNALKSDATAIVIPEEIEEAATSNTELANMIANQKDMFLTQASSQRSKLGTMRQRIEEANEEIKGYKAQVASDERQLELIEEEIKPMARLVKKGYASRPQLLALQRAQQELQGNKGQMLASIAKTNQTITETQLQIDTLQSEYAKQISDEQSDVHDKIASYDEKLRATADIMQRTVITAPCDGVVTGLKHHTVGAVIAPGEAIMDIVPQNEPMIIEARLQPSDIDVVVLDLPATISFTAYKTQSMQRISGRVTYVAADATVEQGAQVPTSYYKSRIEVNPEELAELATQVKLYPGMPVEVFIQTGSRSFLGYLFSPISASMRRAFKED